VGESERQLIDVAGILRMQSYHLDFQYVEHWVETLGLQRQWRAARDKVV
jgi:hypothetical protein